MSLTHKRLGMQATIFFLILALFASEANPRKLIDDESASARHEQWAAMHGKVYNDTMETELRFKIFKENVEFIESFNVDGLKPYKLSINEFADQTNEEFKASRNGYRRPNGLRIVKESNFRYGDVIDVPISVDWRSLGAVTPVKNQGKCESCWAFSAVAATEGITWLTTGTLIPLSEQQLVDCDRTRENQGCRGGHIEGAYDFIAISNGLATESNYPYKGFESFCDVIKEVFPFRGASIKGYESVPVGEDALVRAVAKQPVSVATDGFGRVFQF